MPLSGFFLADCPCAGWEGHSGGGWPPVGGQNVLLLPGSAESLPHHGVSPRRWVPQVTCYTGSWHSSLDLHGYSKATCKHNLKDWPNWPVNTLERTCTILCPVYTPKSMCIHVVHMIFMHHGFAVKNFHR